mgnify:CR=1 FL=1
MTDIQTPTATTPENPAAFIRRVATAFAVVETAAEIDANHDCCGAAGNRAGRRW